MKDVKISDNNLFLIATLLNATGALFCLLAVVLAEGWIVLGALGLILILFGIVVLCIRFSRK